MPVSHEFQPGRLTTTSIVNVSPARIFLVGQICRPVRRTGTWLLAGPVTALTLSIFAPPRGSAILASATGSEARLGLDVLSATPAATTAPTAISRIPPTTYGHRRRAGRGGSGAIRPGRRLCAVVRSGRRYETRASSDHPNFLRPIVASPHAATFP